MLSPGNYIRSLESREVLSCGLSSYLNKEHTQTPQLMMKETQYYSNFLLSDTTWRLKTHYGHSARRVHLYICRLRHTYYDQLPEVYVGFVGWCRGTSLGTQGRFWQVMKTAASPLTVLIKDMCVCTCLCGK